MTERDRRDDTIETSPVVSRIKQLARDTQAKILVVDDDELGLALMADKLHHCGLEVHKAGDGEQALWLLEQQWFPVLLTDWQMPRMDGIELTQRLREKGVADTYVIMLTVRDTSFDYEHAYRAGVDDYLSKKLPEEELFARIHAAFNTVNLRRALAEAQAALANIQKRE
jgi:two-component system, cell cycle response regulator